MFYTTRPERGFVWDFERNRRVDLMKNLIKKKKLISKSHSRYWSMCDPEPFYTTLGGVFRSNALNKFRVFNEKIWRKRDCRIVDENRLLYRRLIPFACAWHPVAVCYPFVISDSSCVWCHVSIETAFENNKLRKNKTINSKNKTFTVAERKSKVLESRSGFFFLSLKWKSKKYRTRGSSEIPRWNLSVIRKQLLFRVTANGQNTEPGKLYSRDNKPTVLALKVAAWRFR